MIGQLANEVRETIDSAIRRAAEELREHALAAQLDRETIDVSMPGTLPTVGHKHPMSIVLDETRDIFLGMGFQIAEGPEVELDYYNFEALNLPKDHPARDTQDTFCLLYTSRCV